MSQWSLWPTRLNYRFEAYSSLTLQRRGIALPGLPDPFLGKTITLDMDLYTPGTFVHVFQGNIVSADPSYDSIGWVITYQCLDLKRRCDLVPFTDSNTKTDSAAYNLQPDDILAIASREGRNVGQILSDVLTMPTNANALNARGVGAYTSLTPPTLPATTVSDLATLTVIPPSGVYVQGEKLIQAIESFMRFWAPNFLFWIQPADGMMRFLDKRTFTNHTLTLGTDLIDPTLLRRSVQDNFQRVIVRGQSIAEPKLLTLQSGGLAEDFAWGTYTTNAAAKAAWSPIQYQKDQQAKDNGSCSCTDTLDVVVTSADSTAAWVANYWDQTSTGHLGQIFLYYSAGSGINQFVSRRIVANAALTAGGSANIQVDLALPATNYNHYQIYGISSGSGMVWRKYKVVDSAIGAAMARQFTYPAIWIGSGGMVETSTSFPMGSVCFSNSGNPPYQEWPAWFEIDPTTSHIYFRVPTYVTCGNHVPSDVRALLAINTGNLTATYPPDSSGSPVYGGTSNTVEGLQDTLTVTVGQWRDPINLTNMVAYAHDLFDSVKDTIVEGSVLYHGLYVPGLTPGIGLSVTGSSYTTGWESLNLSVLECELNWLHGQADQHQTLMHCSNRRAHFTAAAFMRPDRPVGGGLVGGLDGKAWNPFAIFQPTVGQMYSMAAMGPRQTNIPDQTADLWAGMEEGVGLGMGGTGADPYRKRDSSGRPLESDIMKTQQRARREKREQERKDKAEERAIMAANVPAGARPRATPDQLMGAAMQGMQYFESFPEEMEDPAAARRARAASHGSLRQARGFGPDPGEPTGMLDTGAGAGIGAQMADELMDPDKLRRRRRARRTQEGS